MRSSARLARTARTRRAPQHARRLRPRSRARGAQEEEARELVAAMVDANGLESLVLRLGGLDEGVAEEDAAVNNALGTLENMVELQPSVRGAARRAPPRAPRARRAAVRRVPVCSTADLRAEGGGGCMTQRALDHGGSPLGGASAGRARLPGDPRAAAAGRARSVRCTLLPWQVLTERRAPRRQVAAKVVRRTPLLRWLLKRLKPREFDSNKEAAGSLLALLLQTHPPNAQALADANGVDALLTVRAPRPPERGRRLRSALPAAAARRPCAVACRAAKGTVTRGRRRRRVRLSGRDCCPVPA